MATNAKINTYATGDVDLTNMMMVLDRTRIGFMQVSLTEMDTTTLPKVAAGSLLEVSGALYSITADESISTTDPVTETTVADGTVYIIAIPDGNDITFALTATAPTWSDAKQGWYGTGDYASYKCIYRLYKSTSSYHSKFKIKQIKSNTLQVEYDRVVVEAALAAQTVNNTTAKLNTSPSEYVDTHSAFSSATFTAPCRGVYRCSANGISGTNQYSYLSFYKNGSIATPEIYGIGISIIADLVLEYGNTVELYSRTTSNLSITTNQLSFELILPL